MIPISHHRTQSSHEERGFTLIELLMAMVIFSIGMLGLAALQVVSLSQGTGGRFRGTAAFLAHSVLDRAACEGQATATERLSNANGQPSTTTGWVFIGDASGTAITTGTALKFDVNGRSIPSSDTTTTAVFTVNWFSRTGTVNTGTRTGLQEFVVNVTWPETTPGTGSTPVTKAISVSRYVRI